MSPLAISGIVSARFTAAMAPQSAMPLKPCSRLRPCRVSSWAPALSSWRHQLTGSASLPHQPSRVFTVTGIATAAATVSTIRAASSGSRIRPLPPPFMAIFFTGQPMLMSIRKAPAASARLAASAMAAGR